MELSDKKGLPNFSAVFTAFQTKGRGQPGNHWESAKAENLIFSFLLKPFSLAAQQQFRIIQFVSLAISDWLSAYHIQTAIKWPNDIYVGDRKLGGVLIENRLSGKYIKSSVIGIGININQELFSTKPPNPVSLKMLTGHSYNIEKMFQECLNACIDSYLKWQEAGNSSVLEKSYKERLYRAEGLHLYKDKNGLFKAGFYDIESDGHLLLKCENGEKRRYAFKEVSFII